MEKKKGFSEVERKMWVRAVYQVRWFTWGEGGCGLGNRDENDCTDAELGDERRPPVLHGEGRLRPTESKASPLTFHLPIQILITAVRFHWGSTFCVSGTTFWFSPFCRWGSKILSPCFSTFFYVFALIENSICKTAQSWQQLPWGL